MEFSVTPVVRKSIFGLGAAAVLALSGCVGHETLSSRSAPPSETPLDMRWDHLDAGATWTAATMAALETHGTELANIVPRDIETWCPAYPTQDARGRNAFWTGMLSTLSKHESTWRQTAVGGGGKWYGLVQILPGTARGYGCEARSGAALKNGEKNLSCAVRIMAVTVPRDGVVSQGMRGMAADWGPFHSRKKREDMRNWISQQSYCQSS